MFPLTPVRSPALSSNSWAREVRPAPTEEPESSLKKGVVLVDYREKKKVERQRRPFARLKLQKFKEITLKTALVH